MQVLAQITLNFQQPNFVTVYAAQNDRLSRFINAALLDGATPWTFPTGALMTIRYRKPDGTSGWYDTLEDGSPAYTVEEDGSIIFGLAEQALTVPGMVPVELNFYNATGHKLSTLTFIVAVKPSAYSDEDIASSDYYNILTARMQELAELADSAEGDYQEYLSALSGFVGAPRTAAVAADMLDTGLIYVYTGSETGWTYGDWYYYNGREWTSGGVYNSAAISLDDTLTNANKPAQAKAAGDLVLVQDTQPSAPVNKLWFPLTEPTDEQVPTWDEFSELKSSFTNRTAGVVDVVDGVGDLDVADSEGNVILRLANGEIVTKKFDSSALKTMNEDGGEADLDIADIYGNVLARFESGNLETKNFRGFQYVTFQSATANYNSQSLTLTVDKTFRRGDRIVIHMERGAMPWDTGAAVSYYEGQKPIKANWRGDCAWLEHTVMQDGATISAVYAANATGMPNGAVRLEVSLLGDIPITPAVVSVKQDGSGDYTTLRGALDAIGTQANDVLNPYRIEIYPGTFDVMDDYTDDEIAAAAYDQTHFVGPKLLNGMQLVGIGRPHEVVISGTLDTTEWSSSIRGVVSTLNFQGSCAIENLTIKAENLRYCIHDDFQYAFGKMRTVRMKNIVFKASGAMSYSVPNTYGASAREGGTLLFAENCDFSYRAAIHTAQTTFNNSRYYLRNCKASQMGFGDIVDSSDATKQNVAVLDSCDFQQILVNNWIVSAENYRPHVQVFGTISDGAMYQMMPSVLYDTSDVVHSLRLQLAVGTAVEKDLSASSGYPLQWKKATDVSKVNGVIVFNDDDTTYVQYRGYVRTDRLGLASVSNGDLIGIDANGAAVIVQDAANAYGRVVMVDADDNGYVKLEV